METHNDPPNAMSDANTVLDLRYLENVLTQAKAIHEARLNLVQLLGEDQVHTEAS